MRIFREFDNGWCLAMSDEVGKRVVPASVFRFGNSFNGRPTIEFWQRNGTSGMRAFAPGETEDSVRAFLLGIGFTEARRYTPEGDVSLEKIASILGL